MPHLATVSGAVWPAIPADQASPGREGISEQERRIREGDYWSPDAGIGITSDQQRIGDQTGPTYNPARPLGYDTRPPRHPAGHVNLIPRWLLGNRHDGTHEEVDNTPAMPEGQQIPQQIVRNRNTFRAKPQPWDTGLVDPTPES